MCYVLLFFKIYCPCSTHLVALLQANFSGQTKSQWKVKPTEKWVRYIFVIAFEWNFLSLTSVARPEAYETPGASGKWKIERSCVKGRG